MSVVRWCMLVVALVALVALPSDGRAQATLTCEVTAIPGGVCVDGTMTDTSARVVTITVMREALCVESAQSAVSQSREARSRSMTAMRVVDGTATFHLCVSGNLTPPCPEDAAVNEDVIRVTTSPDNLGCTLPAP